MESIWVIGDVHGCRDSLDALLARPEIADDPRCRFWFVGDWSTADRPRPRRCGGSGRWASAPPSCSAITTCGRWQSRRAACGRAAAIRWTSCCARATPRRCWTGCAGSRCCTPKPATCWCTPAFIRAGIAPRRWRARGRSRRCCAIRDGASTCRGSGAVAAVLARHDVGRGRAEVHCPGVHPDAALPPRRHIGAARQGRAGTLAIRHAALVRRPGAAGGAGSRPLRALGNAGIAGAVGRGVPGHRVRIRRRIDSPAPG